MRLIESHELLDDDFGTPTEVARSLDDLDWINRHLGGHRSWDGIARRVAESAPLTDGLKPQTLLDVGAGTGTTTGEIALRFHARGIALDRRVSHLRARPAVVADAFHLPFRDDSIDWISCNLMLHHFHDTAVALLRSLYRVARRAVLVNDLERSWIPYLFVRALGAIRFSRLTRYDAPRSIRQAYTAVEVTDLARRAGISRFDVLRLQPYRLGLILWK